MTFVLDQLREVELAMQGIGFPNPPKEPLPNRDTDGTYYCYECGHKTQPKKFKNAGAYHRHLAKQH